MYYNASCQNTCPSIKGFLIFFTSYFKILKYNSNDSTKIKRLLFSGRYCLLYLNWKTFFRWFLFHIYPVLFKSRYVILKSFLPTYFYFPCPSFLLSNITEKRWLKVLLIEAMHKRKYYVFCILTLYRYYCVHISSLLLSHKFLICLFWGQIICLVACYLFTCLLNNKKKYCKT